MLVNTALADQAIDCKLMKGIYENSTPAIQDLKFETISDVFSITNSRVLSFTLEDKAYRLLRNKMSVDKDQYTKLDFELRENRKALGTAKVVLDRSPKLASEEGYFRGNLKFTLDRKIYLYNFYCSF